MRWLLFLLLTLASCHRPAAQERSPAIVRASSRTPGINPAWSVTPIHIDGQNAGTHASKDNDCLTLATSCPRWDEYAYGRRGGTNPRVGTVNLTISFSSSHH